MCLCLCVCLTQRPTFQSPFLHNHTQTVRLEHVKASPPSGKKEKQGQWIELEALAVAKRRRDIPRFVVVYILLTAVTDLPGFLNTTDTKYETDNGAFLGWRSNMGRRRRRTRRRRRMMR